MITSKLSLSISTPRGIITSFPSSRKCSTDRPLTGRSHVMTKYLSSARLPQPTRVGSISSKNLLGNLRLTQKTKKDDRISISFTDTPKSG